MAREQHIDIPKKYSKSRESLAQIVLKTYNKWEAILDKTTTTLHDLLETFDHLDFSFNVDKGKKDIRK